MAGVSSPSVRSEDPVMPASDPPFGPLQSLVDDPTSQIIRVNRYDHVLVRRGGRQEEMPDVRFPDDLSVRLLVERLTGRQTATLGDLVHPLPGDMLLVAYFPPLSAHVTVSLFKPATKAERWDELIDDDVLPEQAAKELIAAVHSGATVMIVGRPDSGKKDAAECPAGHTVGRRASSGDRRVAVTDRSAQ